MIFSFFIRRFEREQDQLSMLFESLEHQEDTISEKALKLASHIVNMHHILLCDLNNKIAESMAWDVFTCRELSPLSRENFRNTFVVLLDFNEQYNSFSEPHLETILMKLDYILQHNAYHRGQLILQLKSEGLNFPPLHLSIQQDF